MLASNFSSPRIVLIILKCLKAEFIYSNAKVTSSPEIWASVSHGGQNSRTVKRGANPIAIPSLKAAQWC